MDTFDREKALRVWRRVRGTPEEPRIPQLIQEELTDAAALESLASRFPGSRGQQLARMARQDREHAARLRGMLSLTQGGPLRFRAASLPLERTESLLRRCLERKQRRTELYGAMGNDPRFGSLWQTLAAREEAHCVTLLELLGTVSPPDSAPRTRRPQRRRRWR